MSFEVFASAFVTLFVVIDAVGVAPIFAGLVAGAPKGYARTMAIKATFVAAIVLILFAFGGQWLLAKMGVSLDAFRAAGGVLLFLIAMDMVFEKRTERREERAEEVRAEEDAKGSFDDISVFPLAIPMIAGPGAIAAVMLFMAKQTGDLPGQMAIVAALVANLVICLLIFLAAPVVMRLLGKSVASTVTRIFGVLLCALAAQFVLDGVKGVLAAG
jgi:multiple antibiotic resistance protein